MFSGGFGGAVCACVRRIFNTLFCCSSCVAIFTRYALRCAWLRFAFSAVVTESAVFSLHAGLYFLCEIGLTVAIVNVSPMTLVVAHQDGVLEVVLNLPVPVERGGAALGALLVPVARGGAALEALLVFGLVEGAAGRGPATRRSVGNSALLNK